MLSPKKLQYGMLLFLAFLNGWFVSSFGPLIPHFSAATGLDETDFAYLFMVRSAANVFGSFLIKYLLKRTNTQQLTLIYLLVITICLFSSTFSLSTLSLSLTLFFGSAAFVGTVVIIYGATFHLFLNDEPDYWIQLIGFLFGVGAMFGPIFVAIFKLQTLRVLGLTELLIIWGLVKFPLPNLEDG
jgi:MFS family permease